jgi:hypothetical protein
VPLSAARLSGAPLAVKGDHGFGGVTAAVPLVRIDLHKDRTAHRFNGAIRRLQGRRQ